MGKLTGLCNRPHSIINVWYVGIFLTLSAWISLFLDLSCLHHGPVSVTTTLIRAAGRGRLPQWLCFLRIMWDCEFLRDGLVNHLAKEKHHSSARRWRSSGVLVLQHLCGCAVQCLGHGMTRINPSSLPVCEPLKNGVTLVSPWGVDELRLITVGSTTFSLASIHPS